MIGILKFPVSECYKQYFNYFLKDIQQEIAFKYLLYNTLHSEEKSQSTNLNC